MLFRIRIGWSWRDLPKGFSNFDSIFKKDNRWSRNKFMNIFKLFSKYAGKGWIFIDGSDVKAHQYSSGTKNQGISESISGNSSKIDLAIVDADGNPTHQ